MNKMPRPPLSLALAAAVLLIGTGVFLSGGLQAMPPQQGAPLFSLVEVEQLQMQAGSGQDADAVRRLQVAARAGQAPALRALGELALRQPGLADQSAGVAQLRQAALQGDPRARLSLGKLYLNGSSQVAKDYAQSRHWLSLAAAQGDGGAAYYLGLHFASGYGAPPDAAAAAQAFKVAAEQGIPAGMFMLANAYRRGEGLAQDDRAALHWYEAAAERDHPPAAQTLAMAYAAGEMGLVPDAARSQHFLAEALHALKHPALLP